MDAFCIMKAEQNDATIVRNGQECCVVLQNLGSATLYALERCVSSLGLGNNFSGTTSYASMIPRASLLGRPYPGVGTVYPVHAVLHILWLLCPYLKCPPVGKCGINTHPYYTAEVVAMSKTTNGRFAFLPKKPDRPPKTPSELTGGGIICYYSGTAHHDSENSWLDAFSETVSFQFGLSSTYKDSIISRIAPQELLRSFLHEM